jgi:adhesin transport system membrane fusion protein
MNLQLEAEGDVSRAEVLRLQRSVADIRAQMVNKKNKYFQDAQAEMTKAQEELSTQSEQLRDRHQLLEHTELVAPVDAVVNNIRVNTVGGVVRPGDTIIELLPISENLIAEAKIPSSDIAFIAINQAASIKLDAYDSSIYGSLNGKVIYISPDILTEETKQGPFAYYRVRIRLTSNEFVGVNARDIKLRPGLSASVDIKAMDRTVMSYLTKPITKTLNRSMGER